MSAQSRVRWIARHGLAGALLHRHARRGNLDARLMTDLSLRDDPFASYDEIRARGPLSRGPFGFTSASHDVCAQRAAQRHVRRAAPAGAAPRPGDAGAEDGARARRSRRSTRRRCWPSTRRRTPATAGWSARCSRPRAIEALRPADASSSPTTCSTSCAAGPRAVAGRPHRGLRGPAPRHGHLRDPRGADVDARAVPRLGQRRRGDARHRHRARRVPARRTRPDRDAGLDDRPLRAGCARTPATTCSASSSRCRTPRAG